MTQRNPIQNTTTFREPRFNETNFNPHLADDYNRRGLHAKNQYQEGKIMSL
jgi:hypothetical protein